MRTPFCVLLLVATFGAGSSADAGTNQDQPAAQPRPPQSTALPADPLDGWLAYLESALPHEPAAFDSGAVERTRKSADAIVQWAGQIGVLRDARTGDQILREVRRLLAAKQRIDRQLDAALAPARRFCGH